MLEKEYREYKGPEPTAPEREQEFQTFLGDGKVRLNEIIFKLLPPEATVNEMDQLAGFIYNKIFEMWEAKKAD